jgi:hypothetical protein
MDSIQVLETHWCYLFFTKQQHKNLKLFECFPFGASKPPEAEYLGRN